MMEKYENECVGCKNWFSSYLEDAKYCAQCDEDDDLFERRKEYEADLRDRDHIPPREEDECGWHWMWCRECDTTYPSDQRCDCELDDEYE